ncbi:MAG: ATP-binding protein [Rubrivivax sp.]|nr:ATP-binding protein [Rubrivivax sp.]
MNPLRALPHLSSRVHMALGLGGLAVAVVLAATWLGLVPDGEALERRERAALAETLALTTSGRLETQALQPLANTLGLVKERIASLRTLGVRAADGTLVIEAGGHDACWPEVTPERSGATFVSVPLWQNGQPWGQMELCFTPQRAQGWVGWLQEPALQVSLFVFLTGAFGFWLYLGRMLRELDPSRAVPPRVRAAYDTLTEGLLVLDRDGRIVLANRSTATLLGVDATGLVGRTPSDFDWTEPGAVAPLARADLPWQQALADGAPQRDRHLHVARADGMRFSLRANCSPIADDRGGLQALVISFQDVTELERRGEALRAAKEQADAANQAKSQFLASMSHEIRTPMNAILGFTDVLRRSALRDHGDASRHLEIIHSSGQHLLNLINDILDLSKVESGRLEAERVAVAPHRVAQEVVATLIERAQAKGLVLELQAPAALPGTIEADPARLRQVLTNLVGNAIKFTEHGAVRVVLRMERQATGARYVVDVSDSGIGIAPDKLESVFEPFVQAEASTTRRFGGTGLGLTISRGFARAMGGDITVASVPGEGTTFSLWLDAGAVDDTTLVSPAALLEQSAAAAPLASRDWRFAPRRVLVADDGDNNRSLVRLLLEEVGLVVEEAANGRLAVDRVQAGGIDLVLMDMQMPEMDGATATRTLRQLGHTLPVVALTANAMKGFERELDEAGFSGFQTKPIDREALLAELASRLGGVEVEFAPRPATAPAVVTTVTADTAQVDDETPLVSRLASHPRLARLVASFGAEFTARRARMHAALAASDMTELAALAHWLKGSGGSMGYDDLFEPARALEHAAHAGDAARAAAMLATIDHLGRRLERAMPTATAMAEATP